MKLEKIIIKVSKFFRQLFRLAPKRIIPEHLINDVELKFKYHFNDNALIIQALKHRSYLSITGEDRLRSNERLELLGDSVLGLVVTEYLYKNFPDKEEGDLTSIKSLIVSRKILAKIARELDIGQYLLLNEAEEKAGGRIRPSIIADAIEAIIGAIYLDGGLQSAVNFIEVNLLAHIEEFLNEEQNLNFKSILLEYSQGKSYGLPIYSIKNEDGPDHNKLFTIEVKVNKKVLGVGEGNSKKKAEQMAAKKALKKLELI